MTSALSATMTDERESRIGASLLAPCHLASGLAQQPLVGFRISFRRDAEYDVLTGCWNGCSRSAQEFPRIAAGSHGTDPVTHYLAQHDDPAVRGPEMLQRVHGYLALA